MDYREAIAYSLEIPKFTKKTVWTHKEFLRILGNPEKGKRSFMLLGQMEKDRYVHIMQSLLLTEKKTVGVFYISASCEDE